MKEAQFANKIHEHVFLRISIFLVNFKGLEILFHPRKKLESMSETKKRELVATILSNVRDQDCWDLDGEIKIKATFTTGPTNGSERTIGKFEF